MKKNEIDKWEYRFIHDWLRDTFGKANHCENPDCKRGKIKRFEYALKKGYEYEYKRENYIQLCVSCHRLYDTPGFTGKKHKEESKEKMRGKRDFTPWNKGLTKEENPQTGQKRKPYKSGPWNKGLKTGPLSEEHKIKIRQGVIEWHEKRA